MSDIFQLIADEVAAAKPEAKNVGRLSDMDTKEVSLVDFAANKRTFLVVKRNNEGDTPMGAETATATQTETTTTTQAAAEVPTPAQKRVVTLRVEEALERVDALKAALVAATVAKVDADAVMPAEVGREIRAVQFMLKSLAGITSKASTLMVPVAGDLSEIGEITKAIKDPAVKVLDEVGRRLLAIKADVEKATLLDAAQARKVDSTADLLAKIPHATAKAAVILRTSLTDDQRTVALEAIEKAMGGLCDVYVALQTDGIVAKANVATQYDVGSVMHAQAALVEKAVAEILTGIERKDQDALAIEHLREIGKALDVKGTVALEKITGELAVIAKAASMFKDRTNWDLPSGDPNRHTVQLVTEPEPPKTVASFATRTEAKLEALRRNTALVAGVAKAATEKDARFAVATGGKGYQVTDTETKKVVFDGANEAMARAVAVRMSQESKAKKNTDDTGTPADASTTKDTKKEGTVGTTATDTKAELDKVGRPMQGDRLSRLKGIIALFKEALGELQGGAVSMEKFKKVGDTLGILITELQVAKRGAAAQTGGVPDTRKASPEAPNQGSGVQPDTSEIGTMDDVMGEGTQGASDVLKNEGSGDAKDAEIAKLQKELVGLKKAKGAPSSPPTDGEDFVYVEKMAGGVEDDAAGGWPADMNDWNPNKD